MPRSTTPAVCRSIYVYVIRSEDKIKLIAKNLSCFLFLRILFVSTRIMNTHTCFFVAVSYRTIYVYCLTRVDVQCKK